MEEINTVAFHGDIELVELAEELSCAATCLGSPEEFRFFLRGLLEDRLQHLECGRRGGCDVSAPFVEDECAILHPRRGEERDFAGAGDLLWSAARRVVLRCWEVGDGDDGIEVIGN